jgi:hypothetical protein
MRTCLATKHLPRGGIDVGLATEISQNEIYGAARERDHLIEFRTPGLTRDRVKLRNVRSYIKQLFVRWQVGTCQYFDQRS